MNTEKKNETYKRIFVTLVMLSCFLFLGQQLYSKWDDIKAIFRQVDFLYLEISTLILVFGFLLRPTSFQIFTRLSSKRLSYFQSARAYYLTQLTKYLPGGIWVYPSRVVVLKDVGVAASISSLGLVFESLTMVIASFYLGSLFLLGGLTDIAWFKQIQAIVLLGSLLVSVGFVFLPELSRRFTPAFYKKFDLLYFLEQVSLLHRGIALFGAIAVNVLMWVLAGISFHLLVLSFGESGITILLSISVFSIAWLVGFLSIFNPGGVGIREVVIVMILSHILPDPLPLMAAILSRLVWTFGEVFFFLVFFGLDFLRKNRTASAQDSESNFSLRSKRN
jgi:hypothetical protein